jgi:hypothetical protein
VKKKRSYIMPRWEIIYLKKICEILEKNMIPSCHDASLWDIVPRCSHDEDAQAC